LNDKRLLTSATRQVRQQWFSVGIFPLGLFFGLTGNRPQSAPACSFLRYRAFKKAFSMRQAMWTIGMFLMVLTSCKWQSKQTDSKIDTVLSLRDTSISIITDSIETRHFSKNNSLWTPTKIQLDQIDSILIKAINDTLETTNNDFKIKNIKGFYKQYVCYKDNNGDLIVFINAFCHLLHMPVDSSGVLMMKTVDWKNKILVVEDGGACFWRIRINLTRKIYFDFFINGEA